MPVGWSVPVAMVAVLAGACANTVPSEEHFSNPDAQFAGADTVGDGLIADAAADGLSDADADSVGDMASCAGPCEDGDPCTTDVCEGGKCVHATSDEGTACGPWAKCASGKCIISCGTGFETHSLDVGGSKATVCAAEFPAWGIAPLTPAQLTDAGDGTVTDVRTGLQWQQAAPATAYPWEKAKEYCDATLVLAGKSDWRLPTRAELDSLVDFASSKPALVAKVFPGASPAVFWSAITTAGVPTEAWVVDFELGWLSSLLKSNSRAVRCVRGATPPPAAPSRFVVAAAAGTVFDTATKRTWQRTIDTSGGDDGQGGHTWLHAKTWCDKLSLDGGGWRLPDIRELRSLVDTSLLPPALDPKAFPAALSQGAWSSTASAWSATDFWYVDFMDGFSDAEDVAVHHRARCVR